ncbi:MAG: hypothetical protein KDK60_01380 [Chlamydiia bacterium]|nr:hypothetical protein [Chlamydiia bacterium]
MKRERLKKLELELQDLEQWLNLGLVPKKDTERHQEEIASLKKRIDEEKNRLQSMKENGDGDEYSVPKRSAQQRSAFQEPHTLPGVDMEEGSGMTDNSMDNESPTTFETDGGTQTDDEEGTATTISDDDEDPFSDKNRWRRGILEDPDADSW